jgi:hypothetical protein
MFIHQIDSRNIPLKNTDDQIYYSHFPLDNNTPPVQPEIPQGPTIVKVGGEYSYSSYTIDPDNDMVYYLFDWGDGSYSEWIGPFHSGENMSETHSWTEQGVCKVRIQAKDSHNALSNWSDFITIEILGPYLSFTMIEGGLGLTIEIQNIGNLDARNIDLSLEAQGGFLVRLPFRHYELPSLSPGESATIHVPVRGLGLGVILDFPMIKISLNADNSKTRGKQVVARIFGPLVKKVGEYWYTNESFEGYVLYTPMVSLKTFLINNSGDVVHTWKSNYKPALTAYLLEDGNLLRTAFSRINPRFFGGGIGGRVEIIDWNGTVLWDFEYSNSYHCLHHDVEMLPNGNILMIAWEYKSKAEAIAAGRNPNTMPMGELWSDHIIEVEPTGSSGGNIVWEWHSWDHLIQDYDPSKENYGVVEDHPELIDINYGAHVMADWNHINTVDYNEEFDQIMLSVLIFNECWVIDHSTTTAEAASHSGGNSGKGGDILYRWGNPQTYGAGDENDKRFFNQHDAHWIPSGLPGGGNILIFNNGRGRPGGDSSSVDEIVPPVDSSGYYYLEPGSSYGPEETIWSYTADNPTDFYAINLASAQRLPNGNTLICDGPHGYFFEITPVKELVWEYLNQEPNLVDNHVFKIHRYAPDYPGLSQLFQ